MTLKFSQLVPTFVGGENEGGDGDVADSLEAEGDVAPGGRAAGSRGVETAKALDDADELTMTCSGADSQTGCGSGCCGSPAPRRPATCQTRITPLFVLTLPTRAVHQGVVSRSYLWLTYIPGVGRAGRCSGATSCVYRSTSSPLTHDVAGLVEEIGFR